MFKIVQSELDDRILTIKSFQSHIETLEDGKDRNAITCKGLIFVQLYAVYEYAVREVVRTLLASIKLLAPPHDSIKSELLSLVLNGFFDSASQSSEAKRWEARITLLDLIRSPKPIGEFSDTIFPSDGSHYRSGQLRTIWRVFGIDEPIVAEMKHLGRIDELVENRNAIAHGRITAEDIGKRYSSSDITKRVDDIELICSHILDTLRSHFTKSGFLL